MMNKKIGFFWSYLLGLDPSKMPAWGVARSVDVADAAVDAVVTVFVMTDAIEAMIVGGIGCHWSCRLSC